MIYLDCCPLILLLLILPKHILNIVHDGYFLLYDDRMIIVWQYDDHHIRIWWHWYGTRTISSRKIYGLYGLKYHIQCVPEKVGFWIANSPVVWDDQKLIKLTDTSSFCFPSPCSKLLKDRHNHHRPIIQHNRGLENLNTTGLLAIQKPTFSGTPCSGDERRC